MQDSEVGEGRGGKGGGEALKLPPEQQAKLGRGEMVAVEDEYGFTYLWKSHYRVGLLRVKDATLPQRTVWS